MRLMSYNAEARRKPKRAAFELPLSTAGLCGLALPVIDIRDLLTVIEADAQVVGIDFQA